MKGDSSILATDEAFLSLRALFPGLLVAAAIFQAGIVAMSAFAIKRSAPLSDKSLRGKRKFSLHLGLGSRHHCAGLPSARRGTPRYSGLYIPGQSDEPDDLLLDSMSADGSASGDGHGNKGDDGGFESGPSVTPGGMDTSDLLKMWIPERKEILSGDYRLMSVSANPAEPVHGIDAPMAPGDEAKWAEFVASSDIDTVLLMCMDGGGPTDTTAALISASSEAGLAVHNFNPTSDGAMEQILSLIRQVHGAGRKLVIVSEALAHAGWTDAILALWVMKERLGYDNFLEACEVVASREKHTGVRRSPDPTLLEQLCEQGHF